MKLDAKCISFSMREQIRYDSFSKIMPESYRTTHPIRRIDRNLNLLPVRNIRINTERDLHERLHPNGHFWMRSYSTAEEAAPDHFLKWLVNPDNPDLVWRENET